MGTSGSEGGQQKPTSRETGRALLSDPYTEHPTAEGKVYLCAVKDCYSTTIVGYSIDSRMKASLAVSAIRNAIALRAPVGAVLHSDRGSQTRFNRLLHHRLVGVMVVARRVLRLVSSSRGFCGVWR